MNILKDHWIITFKRSLLRTIEQEESFDFELLERISTKKEEDQESNNS